MKKYFPRDITPEKAIKIQKELKPYINLKKSRKKTKLIGGADVSYSKLRKFCYGTIIIMKFDTLQIIEQ